ncbi:hypothetical protein [Solimonas terrae]|uniref:Uncharacterized protein n=1 Tax=Solimonas terrae TaxID=1396819 RepID=A0A6M2BSX5_9GAMM|nr:hypothetical protein [Solimonas terrae]NGY05203.1 hypothetical protein [Solimonas terrae]
MTYKFAEIDPMALILSERAYLIWTELHHPHEPALKNIAAVAKILNPEERKFAQAKASAMVAYGRAMEEGLRA